MTGNQHLAHSDYLAWCEERGEEPDKPFSGKFMVRTTPELHRDAAGNAAQRGLSLNAYVTDCIQAGVGSEARRIEPSISPTITTQLVSLQKLRVGRSNVLITAWNKPQGSSFFTDLIEYDTVQSLNVGTGGASGEEQIEVQPGELISDIPVRS